MVNETYPSGRVVTNQFQADGSLAQVNGAFQGNAKTYVGNFNYTSAGAVSNLQLGNGRWENTQFNARLQPTQIGLGSSVNAQDLWKVNYDYGTTDNNGNVKSQQITVPNQFTANQVYSYDSLNRLKSAQETISGSQTWKQTYTFDRYGNRKFDATQTTTLGNCPVNVCNPDVNPANNKVVGQSFDNAGNTTVDAEGKQFFYDAENKQKEVRNASNQIIGQYLFDGDGKRVKKLSSQETVIFVFDAGGKLASEYQISASQSQSPTTSYLTNDTLGSPRIVTDSTGNVTSRRDFMPYGEEIYRANQGTDKVRQKFTGYERDNESGLDYAKARMFGRGLGRFTSPDPLLSSGKAIDPQSWNRFTYVGNNPLNFTDPSGLTWVVSNERADNGMLTYQDLYGKALKSALNGGFSRVVFGENSSFVMRRGIPIFEMFKSGGGRELKTPSVGGNPIQELAKSIAENSVHKGAVVGTLAAGAAVVGATGGAILAAAPAVPVITTLGLTETAIGTGTTVATVAAAHPQETEEVVEAVGVTVSRTADRLGHIFSDSSGHVNPITSASQGRIINLFERVANNPDNVNPNVLNNFQRINNGFQGFSQTFRNGQVWTQVRNSEIINAGVNRTPR